MAWAPLNKREDKTIPSGTTFQSIDRGWVPTTWDNLPGEPGELLIPWVNTFGDPNADIDKEVQDFSDKLDQVKFPKKTTVDEAVVSWDEVVDDTTPEEDTPLEFNWDTIEAIAIKQDRWKTLTEEEKDLLSKFKVQLAEWKITRETFFKWDTTTTDPSLVSNEQALNIADRLLDGDKEFSNLWLQPSQINNPERVREFFLSQWYTSEQTTAIQNALDTRLREWRITEDRQTIVERKEQEINERIEREKADLLEQVDRSQKLLQRQRSLRWVWRSSATEADMLDLQEKWEDLINAATTKANNELTLFRMQQEWAEAEAIDAARKALSDSTSALNQKILDQVELENKLVAQGKQDSDAAWESLMSTLSITWVDKEWADKFVSTELWYLADKFWTAILDSTGSKIPVGWTTAANAETIDNFAKWVLAWDITFWSVPDNLRENVVNAWAALKKQWWVLSASQLADSPAIAKQIFWNTTERNVNAVQWLMMEWLSNEEILTRLKNIWFSPEYTWAIKDWMKNVLSWGWFTKEQRWFVEDEFNRKLDEWNEKWAKEYMLLAALEASWESVQSKVTWRRTLINSMINLEKGLEDYKKAWGDTWKLAGITEKWFQSLLWSTTDAKLATILGTINLAIQWYRQSMSWAAFSESESEEYKDIFPWIGKSWNLNKSKIQSVISTFARANEDFYSWKLWATPYKEIFPDGVSATLHPWMWFDRPKDLFEWIDPEADFMDIADMYETNLSWDIEDFDINDTDATKSFLDFNSADQPAESKDLGFQEGMEIARTWDNVAKDTNNPWNITADSIPAWQTKEQYAKKIWATGTYLSPNGREYFVFDDIEKWKKALLRDVLAKIEWRSKNIKPTDTLKRFQRVYVWETSPWYLSVLRKITWATDNTPIKDINPDLLTQAVMKAEWFNS